MNTVASLPGPLSESISPNWLMSVLLTPGFVFLIKSRCCHEFYFFSGKRITQSNSAKEAPAHGRRHHHFGISPPTGQATQTENLVLWSGLVEEAGDVWIIIQPTTVVQSG